MTTTSPSPWSTRLYGVLYEIHDADDALVADVFASNNDTANAELIARAPTLAADVARLSRLAGLVTYVLSDLRTWLKYHDDPDGQIAAILANVEDGLK